MDNRRSQRRVLAAVPVRVRGVDTDGDVFEESTEALEVSRRGFSILTKRDLHVSAPLIVVFPGRGPGRTGRKAADFLTGASVMRIRRDGRKNLVSVRFVGATLPTYTSEDDGEE